jgi:hypothetical protein
VGANTLGLLLPVVVAVLATLGAYFPIGMTLPFSHLLNGYTAILLGFGISAVILFGGPVYALLAWSWQPFALAAFFGLSLIFGLAIALMASDGLVNFALQLFNRRSAMVINAVLEYEHANGEPPTTLVDLVPDQLSSTPTTGMSVDPDYEYEPNSGLCSPRNSWNLSIRLPGEFLLSDYLVYCPAQDYVWFDSQDRLDMRGNWQYIRND